jgi:hypothetical protein
LPSPAPPNRFERHPWLTGLGLLAVALALVEGALRLADPVPLRFAHEMRRIHRYSRAWRVDLVPSTSARLRLDRSDGSPLLDFRLATGEDGFRLSASAPAAAPETRFVHAIGDSYTMGWGVDAPDSWPAVLDRRLPGGLRAVNLGVDGFGALGATGKSMALADRYPPALSIYLLSPNDASDDEQAASVAARPLAAHLASEAFDAVRRASYLANVPFAVRYRRQFRFGPARPAPASGGADAALDRPLLDMARLPAPDPRLPTFPALLRYRDFLAGRGARLVVLVLSTQLESLRAYRFCREQGIEAVLFDTPPAMRIPDEGHFNAAGNRAVAALALSLIPPAGGGEPPGAGGKLE